MSGNRPAVEPATLYVVATPLGNLEDITLRALRTLRAVDIIVAEDTRTTAKLLSYYKIKGPKLISLHEHNEKQRARGLVDSLRRGAAVALVSEAGTPAISDPGAYLIAEIHRAGLKVRPVPGPSAVITALSCAGFDIGEGFFFVGFLPSKASLRIKRLEELRFIKVPLVFYEAPHRLLATLVDLLEMFGDREVFMAREMTKKHEQYLRTTIKELYYHFQQKEPRGEFTLVVAGASACESIPSEEDIAAFLKEARAQGLSIKDAAKEAAKFFGLPRTQLYKKALELFKKDD